MKQKIPDIIKTRFLREKEIKSPVPFAVIAAIQIALLVVEIIFTVVAISLGILPAIYIVVLIVLLLAIDIGLFVLMTNRKRRVSQFYIGALLSLVLMVLLLPASYMLSDAGSALRSLAKMGAQWEKYDVVAMKDSSYESIGDIRGKTVYVLDNDAKMNVEAREKLVTKAEVTVVNEDKDVLTLGYRIFDAKERTHDELILISDSQYGLLCDEIDHFKKNTKVIYSQKIMKRSDNYSSSVDVTRDPFNVYVTGIDVWGDINKVSRSDVNMIVTINPRTREILLTSIPRDSYVPLHSFGQLDKLTHSGIYGVDETLNTVTDWLGVDFDYYVKINFDMVVKLVNAMGGISVYSDRAFKSSISDFEYVKGKNRLSGKGALYFARERKSFEGSDEERIKNQQLVMEGIINKVTSHKEILLNYSELLGIVSEYMTTNMSDKDMRKLVKLQLKDMDTKWSVRKVRVSGNGVMRGTYSMGMGRELFVSIPRPGSVEHVQKAIHDTMYPVESGEGVK